MTDGAPPASQAPVVEEGLETPQQAAAVPPGEAGGDPAAAVASSENPTNSASVEEGAQGSGQSAGTNVASANGGGTPAGEAAKGGGDEKNVMAPASSVPAREPLGPGPFGLDDFDTGVTLGTGSFGRVRIATHKGTQTPWAIKILKKAEIIRMQQVRARLDGMRTRPRNNLELQYVTDTVEESTIYFKMCRRLRSVSEQERHLTDPTRSIV